MLIKTLNLKEKKNLRWTYCHKKQKTLANHTTILFFFFCLFRATLVAPGSSQGRGWIRAAGLHHSHSNSRSELYLQPIPQLMGNARSLTHWMGPRIEPVSSWILVRFVTIKPQWELHNHTTVNYSNKSWIFIEWL